MSLADIKRAARQAVHSGLAVPALCVSQAGGDPRPVLVRWHNKLAPALGIEQGGAGIVTGIERLIFSADDLAAPSDGGEPITLSRGDTIQIPGYTPEGPLSLNLDNEGNADGPLYVYWSVTSQEGA